MRKNAAIVTWAHLLLLAFTTITFGERIDFDFPLINTWWFPEGVTIELWCKQDSTDDIEISYIPDSTEIIVKHSNLRIVSNRYSFQTINSTTCVFVIKSLSRNDDSLYSCRAGPTTKFVKVRVQYSPSKESLLCKTNYDSPVIFHDLRQDHINFTCVTEKGNPSVLMSLSIFKLDEINNITAIANICTVHDQDFDSSRSFSCLMMTEYLENSTFLCDVTQKFPALNDGNYQNSCSFGPLKFSSNFSISISESNISVKDGDDVTLACSTNVSGVEIKWTDIPQDWEYDVTNSEYSSHLKLYYVKQPPTSKIVVECIGSFGNRSVKDSVIITIIKGGGQLAIIPLIICPLLFLVCITSSLLISYRAWKNRMYVSFASKFSSGHQRSQESEGNDIQMTVTTNTNNANNTATGVYDEDEKRNTKSLKDNDNEGSDTWVNPIYESTSYVTDTMLLQQKKYTYTEISRKDS
ncbi:hypothetical protein HOLleu_40395 [Holothuria leucospilota]|uniref:Ig-like domain-containing protein n=1 Tax=Holothuria leucospilota TaxID=206669 RepID=A0A9Q0YDK1_HOLLE|nr:hypothetical protein HOLleu_40395 [Holothuria leucospilota]